MLHIRLHERECGFNRRLEGTVLAVVGHEALFAMDMIDLGELDVAYSGILAPARSKPAVGVSSQFLEQAHLYHESYFDTALWKNYLKEALQIAGNPEPRTILDIGSGSGNSILPLAEIFPDAHIIATDVSPQLLRILRDFLNQRRDASRFTLACIDATSACYENGIADLVVGAAILHHVYEPEPVLASARKALASGGWAMFFEPLEGGSFLLTTCYERIIAEATPEERDTPAMKLATNMANAHRARSSPRSDPIFEKMDDKWLFTRTEMEQIQLSQGWKNLFLLPLNDSETILRTQAETNLRLGAKLPPSAMPDWAWSIIDSMDTLMSQNLRRELATEAAIIMKAP